MSYGLSSTVLKEIDISNNEEHTRLLVDLPYRWWTTTYSFNNFLTKKNPVIFPINTKRYYGNRTSPLPNVSYWKIEQGDYVIKDRLLRFNDLMKRKNYTKKFLFLGFVICSGLIVFLVSNILNYIA